MLHGKSPAHTIKHTKRVLRNVLWLVEKLELDINLKVLIVSALLHDVSRSEGYSGDLHGKMSFLIAQKFISGLDLESDEITLIEKCITHHSIDDKTIRKNLEEKIIYDADRLEGFGIKGYLRILSYHYFEKRKPLSFVLWKMKYGMEKRRKNLHFKISKKRSRKLF